MWLGPHFTSTSACVVVVWGYGLCSVEVKEERRGRDMNICWVGLQNKEVRYSELELEVQGSHVLLQEGFASNSQYGRLSPPTPTPTHTCIYTHMHTWAVRYIPLFPCLLCNTYFSPHSPVNTLSVHSPGMVDCCWVLWVHLTPK